MLIVDVVEEDGEELERSRRRPAGIGPSRSAEWRSASTCVDLPRFLRKMRSRVAVGIIVDGQKTSLLSSFSVKRPIRGESTTAS